MLLSVVHSRNLWEGMDLQHLLYCNIWKEEKVKCEMSFRERHAKTLEIAQEEVLTCLGICMAERIHKVHRRLKEEETVCKVLAAVAIDALSRNFQVILVGKIFFFFLFFNVRFLSGLY